MLGLVLLATPAFADRLDPLIDRALRHDNYKVRLKAATGLGRVKDERAVETLVIVLGDPHPLVRAAAANALGRKGDPAALAPLCKLRNDRDAFVKKTVLAALKSFGGVSGCTSRKIYLEIRVSGEEAPLQAFVEQKLLEQAAKDPRVVLGRAEDFGSKASAQNGDPREAVKNGEMPGVELKVRVSRDVQRTAANTRINCQLAQAIFDLKLRALRGSATQRAAIDLGTSKVNEKAIDGQLRQCLAALAPVVYEGLGSYLDRVQ